MAIAPLPSSGASDVPEPISICNKAGTEYTFGIMPSAGSGMYKILANAVESAPSERPMDNFRLFTRIVTFVKTSDTVDPKSAPLNEGALPSIIADLVFIQKHVQGITDYDGTVFVEVDQLRE